MAAPGKYLYGFAESGFSLAAELPGLAGAPVHPIRFQDIAALVSDHPVEKLSLLRRNLEPHHRVIREITKQTTFIPATFGHISEDQEQILEVLRENHAGIRAELERLAGRVEMGVKLLWDVDNIFDFFVSSGRELRNRRDRVFGKSRPTLEEKLELGAFFDKRLKQERERLGNQIIEALRPLAALQLRAAEFESAGRRNGCSRLSGAAGGRSAPVPGPGVAFRVQGDRQGRGERTAGRRGDQAGVA